MITLPPLRPLPATRYVSPFLRVRCSHGCNGQAQYHSAVGLHYCVRCYKRHVLIEQVQYLFDAWRMDRVAVRRSYLGAWLDFARMGNDEEIARAIEVMRGVV